jgi:hypothetical protein
MPVYIVYGNLGAGKTLAAVGRLRDYASRGNKIAGNIDLHLSAFSTSPHSKTTYTRIPDRPTANDLLALGIGNETYEEDNNGLLVLDEIATWLNSRTWNEKGRAALMDWFVHARKYGWDIIFLVQYMEMMDTQIREALAEYHVEVVRMDRINIPVVGALSKNFHPQGKPLRFPKIHMAKVMYKGKIKADRWIYRAKDLYAAYDTKQVISDDYPHGVHSQLSRWHLEGRYMGAALTWRDYSLFVLKSLVYLAFIISRTPLPRASASRSAALAHYRVVHSYSANVLHLHSLKPSNNKPSKLV